MTIPARYAPLLFSALLSTIMVAIVSAFVLATTRGFGPDFALLWAKSVMRTWPVAFPTVAVVAPMVRRFVGRVTA